MALKTKLLDSSPYPLNAVPHFVVAHCSSCKHEMSHLETQVLSVNYLFLPNTCNNTNDYTPFCNNRKLKFPITTKCPWSTDLTCSGQLEQVSHRFVTNIRTTQNTNLHNIFKPDSIYSL